MAYCNCNVRNGSDVQDFLVPNPGNTDADATYLIGLTHFTCGNRKMSLNDQTHPVVANLTATPIGSPIDVGNGSYCQECLIAGTVTYCPCNSCSPQTEYVSKRICLPCSTATSPTLTIGTVVASPKPIMVYVNGGCGCCQQATPCTNQIAITTSINVTPAA